MTKAEIIDYELRQLQVVTAEYKQLRDAEQTLRGRIRAVAAMRKAVHKLLPTEESTR